MSNAKDLSELEYYWALNIASSIKVPKKNPIAAFDKIKHKLLPFKILDTNFILDLAVKYTNHLKKVKSPKVTHKWPKWPNAAYISNNVKHLKFKENILGIDGSIGKFKGKEFEIIGNVYNKPPENIDGIPLLNKFTPVDLKKDVLTGLTIGEELKNFKGYIHNRNVGILEFLDHYHAIKHTKITRKAYKTLQHTIPRIKQLIKNHFTNKELKGLEHPHLFITMGGSGAGKGRLLSMAERLTDYNIIETSLDKSRYLSDFYKLLVIADHHADDYKIIEQFAHAIRDGVLNYAMKHSYNVLFDGSGIPYKGRYDKLVEIFKNAGYRVHILACDIPFYHPTLPSAYSRIINRFSGSEDHRALPWKIALEKHKSAPLSFIQALNDPNLESVDLYDTLHEIPRKIACKTTSKTPYQLSNECFLEIQDEAPLINFLKKCLINSHSKGVEDLLFRI